MMFKALILTNLLKSSIAQGKVLFQVKLVPSKIGSMLSSKQTIDINWNDSIEMNKKATYWSE